MVIIVRDPKVGRPLGTIPDVLDGRTVEILQMCAEGSSQKEIAERLHYGERTVKKKIQDARKKTGTRNTTHLVSWCLRRGVIR